jgi:RHS repeat-associated protein
VYAGEYWDQDAQLLYLRARWYDPRVGRFISADPFEGKQRDPRSLNRYAYAGGDPLHATDRSGRMTAMETGVAVSAGIGASLGAASAYLANQALGKATYAEDIMIGGILGAGAGVATFFAPPLGIALGLYGVHESGALVADVWLNDVSTPKQKAAASVLLVTSIAGSAAGYRLAGTVGPIGRGNGILHDLSVGSIAALFRSVGLTVQTSGRVRNPYYVRGREYDLYVKKPSSDEWIGIEFKSSLSAYERPVPKQAMADGWVAEHGGVLSGTGQRVTGVIRINGGRVLPPNCTGTDACN